jgi:hypothetical protein
MQEACCSAEVETRDSTGLAGPGIDTRSVEELEEEMAELCAHIDAATYRLLRAIGEVDRREAWPVGFLSMAHWLSWRVGRDLRTAREKVRVARALEGLPLISEAFPQGRMSYSKVRAMCRIATLDNEEYLLYIAENGTTEDVERVVRGYGRATGEPCQAAECGIAENDDAGDASDGSAEPWLRGDFAQRRVDALAA